MGAQTPTSIFVISGRYFDVANPDPKDVRAWDIAYALSGENRFGNHTYPFWDVLSHTGLVYMLAMQDTKGALSTIDKFALLIHDASEAYAKDLPRPLRLALPEYKERIETPIMNAVLARFGVRRDQINWDLVARYDNQALYIEREVMLAQFSGFMSDSFHSLKQYDMAQFPKLVKAKPQDYIMMLREIALQLVTSGVNELFELPEHMNSAVATAAQPRQSQAVQTQGPAALKHDFSRQGHVDIPEERASLTLAQVKAQAKPVGEDEDIIGGSEPTADYDLYGTRI